MVEILTLESILLSIYVCTRFGISMAGGWKGLDEKYIYHVFLLSSVSILLTFVFVQAVDYFFIDLSGESDLLIPVVIAPAFMLVTSDCYLFLYKKVKNKKITKPKNKETPV